MPSPSLGPPSTTAARPSTRRPRARRISRPDSPGRIGSYRAGRFGHTGLERCDLGIGIGLVEEDQADQFFVEASAEGGGLDVVRHQRSLVCRNMSPVLTSRLPSTISASIQLLSSSLTCNPPSRFAIEDRDRSEVGVRSDSVLTDPSGRMAMRPVPVHIPGRGGRPASRRSR